MTELHQTAHSIAEGLLEITGQALMAGHSKRFLSCFRVPHVVVTELGARKVNDLSELGATFERVRWHYRASGITKMERSVVAADFLEQHVVLTVHEARIFRGNEFAQDPFLVMSEIDYADGEWRIRYSNYAIHDSLRHQRALHGPRPIDEMRAIRNASPQPDQDEDPGPKMG